MDIEEAVDVLKELEGIYGSPNPFKDDKDYDRAVAIQTVLNELDKDNNIISDLQNEVTLKQCELDKKDKIINEMTESIFLMNGDRGCTKQEKIDYFTKKVEDK